MEEGGFDEEDLLVDDELDVLDGDEVEFAV